MDDRDFIPFVPRVVSADDTTTTSAARSSVDQPAETLAPQLATADVTVMEETAASAADDAPALSAPASPTSASMFSDALEDAIELDCRAIEIRNEAVRIACIATGRILKHAVAFDPAVIARFVDDAIAAAQQKHALVHVHPEHAAALAARGIACKPDERCVCDEVIVDLPSGSLSATVEERASLIVRAVANG